MKVRTSDDGNFGRRARFRRATREEGDGGRATREDDDGRGAKPFGVAPIARGERGRASRARARANGAVMRGRYRSVRMKRSGGFVRCARAGDGARGTRMGTMDEPRCDG